MRSKGRGSFGTVVYIYVPYIYTNVFNYGLALIRKYMYGGTYMEVFSCNLEPRFTFCIYNCWDGLKLNSCAGTLIVKHVA